MGAVLCAKISLKRKEYAMKYPEIKERFEQVLSKKGITARELAERSAVNETSISQYVNGHHKPSNISSGRMAEVLGVDPLWLMGYDVPMIPTGAAAAGLRDGALLAKINQLSDRDKKVVEQMVDSILDS